MSHIGYSWHYSRGTVIFDYNINNGDDNPYSPYFLGKLVSSQKILIFSGAN
jgi:hypothetical protein